MYVCKRHRRARAIRVPKNFFVSDGEIVWPFHLVHCRMLQALQPCDEKRPRGRGAARRRWRRATAGCVRVTVTVSRRNRPHERGGRLNALCPLAVSDVSRLIVLSPVAWLCRHMTIITLIFITITLTAEGGGRGAAREARRYEE